MVQFFGTVERSVVENGQQTTVFRIPAFSREVARQRAKANARIKGLSSPSVNSVDEAGSTDIPGQNFYDVEMKSDR